ncbi:3-dehydroquinate synthase [Agaribacterium haliotis]|uniref:3-dehydroquinate synthase n=1 Tax=Agaribacterium haliotis TaxID=2013869 RepID=UPI000BB53703|nr:3-dehydroquinate synthase [Agaribacterium haliotis]
MAELRVDLGDRSYPIFIGEELLTQAELLRPYIGSQLLVVTNETIQPLFADSLLESLQALGLDRVELLALPDGEAHKNLDTVNLVFDHLLQGRFNRKATLLALGGGVVGDMVGFAAACYQRGVNFIQVPTTLLSQVDSSVGGKTGVNHPLGKNMIGAFYQPQAVVIDLSVLKTLPRRELSAGLAEVIKYGLIYDAGFFEWLELNMARLMALDSEAMAYAIERSCAIKAEVVAKDEKEGGLRAILNLGHTFGHAIEAHQGYGDWLHGEAVAVGMLMAVDLSVRLGWLDASVYERTYSLLMAADLPLASPQGMGADDYMRYMSVDKKVLDSKLRLVLLKALGSAVVSDDFEPEALAACFERFCQ